MSRTLALYMLLYFIVFPGRAMAGNILFVNYNGSDNGIPTAISTDGHSVTSVDVPPETASTYFQSANLNQYCAVVWSAAYAYDKDVSGAVTTLSNWVTSGGHVLITTPDAIRNDGGLIGLIGGSGGTDQGNGYSTITNVSNSVTTGLIDIRGHQPYDVGDEDSLCAPLTSGTIGLVTSGSTRCPSEPGYTWTLRTLGCGQVAFITSGNFSSFTTNDPNWTLTTIPGHGVYNAGLRNFVYNACTSQNACFPWSMFLPAMTGMGKR